MTLIRNYLQRTQHHSKLLSKVPVIGIVLIFILAACAPSTSTDTASNTTSSPTSNTMSEVTSPRLSTEGLSGEVQLTFFDGNPQVSGLVRTPDVVARTNVQAGQISFSIEADELASARYVQMDFPAWRASATFDILDNDDNSACSQRVSADATVKLSFGYALKLDVNDPGCNGATSLGAVLELYDDYLNGQVNVALFSEGDLATGQVTGVYSFADGRFPNIGVSTRSSHIFLALQDDARLGSYQIRTPTPRSLEQVEVLLEPVGTQSNNAGQATRSVRLERFLSEPNL
ncbi:MAG: hypothetical protein AAF267_12035 [Deinococcota bacterium]